mgnify:CR=1 FL=1|tara:strand:+ start:1978 stop:2769 length:792 start_codon:yes stop_codon:yes gene_type:complete
MLQPIPDKLVVLTFDDGHRSDLHTVVPLLQRFCFGATFFIPGRWKHRADAAAFLTWEEVEQLDSFGFEVGNHTLRHPNLLECEAWEVAKEIDDLHQCLSDRGISPPVSFCYPGFHHNPLVASVVQEKNFLFARRGVDGEFKTKEGFWRTLNVDSRFEDGNCGARGPTYDITHDHPLLIPITLYYGSAMSFDDVKWAVSQAVNKQITVLCYHGVPEEKVSISTSVADFKQHMEYLHHEGCQVIAMRDLQNYVDPAKFTRGPYDV